MKNTAFFATLCATLLARVSATTTNNEEYDHLSDTSAHSFNISSETLTDPFPFYFPVPDAQQEDETPLPMPLCYGTRIEEASIVELQGYLTNGCLTSVQLVECYLRRIMQVDTYVE